MKYRSILCEDNEFVHEILYFILDDRGHEILSFKDAGECPLHSFTECRCDNANPCADIIVSDVSMPMVNGLDFVEKLRKKGCKIKNIALVSGYWTESDISRAIENGCTVFHKPLKPQVLNEWLENCEKSIDSQRILTDIWSK